MWHAMRLCGTAQSKGKKATESKAYADKCTPEGAYQPHHLPFFSVPVFIRAQYHQPFLRLQSLLVAPFKSSTLSTSTPSLTKMCQTWFRKPRGQLGTAQ